MDRKENKRRDRNARTYREWAQKIVTNTKTHAEEDSRGRFRDTTERKTETERHGDNKYCGQIGRYKQTVRPAYDDNIKNKTEARRKPQTKV